MIPWWGWGLLGLLALVGESISMALFLLNVAIAAFVATILALLGVPIAAQAGAFVFLSVLLIMLARPRMLRLLVGRPQPSLTTAGALVGRVATVTEPITLDGGVIRLGKAEFWSARATTPAAQIEAGSHVRIARVEGVTAYVEPLDPLSGGAESTFAPSSGAADKPSPRATLPVPQGESVRAPVAGTAPRPLSFGELLKRHRSAANLTQEELAERARLSVRAISDLERGLHRTPQRDTVHLLAEALELAPEDRAAFEAAARRLVEH